VFAEMLVADAVETSNGGKISALGVYMDRVIVLTVPADAPEVSAEKPYGVSIGMAFCLWEVPDGTHAFSIKFEDEAGRLMPSALEGRFDHIPGMRAVLTHRFNPFFLTRPGTCSALITVGESVARVPFEFRVNRLPSADASAAGNESQ
jgi:hypothetical protein